MIKVVSFDLDGTLVKSTYADKVWLEGLPKIYSKEKNIKIDQAKSYIYDLYEKVGEDRKEWYDIEWWFNKFQLKSSWQKLLDSYANYIELFPETYETLEILSKKFLLIIISNAKKEFIEIQLQKTGIKPFFKHVFSSLSDFNLVKKTPEVYKNVLKLLKIRPGEIIHVGDNFEFDFKSPQRICINSFYLNRKKSKKENQVIFSLSEIENIFRNKLEN